MEDKFVNAALSDLKHFELPPIASIIPFECQPDYLVHAQAVNKVMFEKLNITDVVEKLKFIDLKLPWFTSMIQPKGQDDERMVLSLLMVTIFFVFDDIMEPSTVESTKGLRDMVIGVAEGAPLSSFGLSQDPLFLLYDEVMSKFREMMTPSLYSHFLGCINKYFVPRLQEGIKGKQAVIHDPEEYRVLRRDDAFGVAVTAVLGEFIMGLEINEGDKQSSAYIDLVEEVVDHCLLVNDILSFRKEYYKRNQQKVYSWLLVLLHSRRCSSLQDAVYETCQMIRESEARIVKLQKKLVEQATKSDDNGHLQKLADALPLCASGNLRWSYCTSRYHGFNNPLINNQPFHGTWIMHPERTIILPPKALLKSTRHLHHATVPRPFAYFSCGFVA